MKIEIDINNQWEILAYLKNRIISIGFTLDANVGNWHSVDVPRFFTIDCETKMFAWGYWDIQPPVEPTLVYSLREAAQLLDFIQQNIEVLQDEPSVICHQNIKSPSSSWNDIAHYYEKLKTEVSQNVGYPILLAYQKYSTYAPNIDNTDKTIQNIVDKKFKNLISQIQ